MLKIVFMGSDAIALPALDWLTRSTGSGQVGSGLGEVVAVFTQPDRAAGRGQQVQANAIKVWAQARGIPVHQPAKVGPEEQAQVAAIAPDLILIMAYGHILRQELIDTPRLGTLNLHTSILPRYRGASPIQTATACGDRVTGVTLMKIVRQLDAGPVADVERVAIAPLDTAAEVEAKLAQACVPLLARGLPAIATGSQTFIAQDPTAATFCRRLEKADGVLDFSAPAGVLAARINGLNPWPGCTVMINGQAVKLGLADALEQSGGAPGTVVGADAEGLLVAAGQGTLRLRKLQRPGGKLLPAPEFLRGWPVAAGTLLPSQPMPPLVAAQAFPYRKG
ncbi:Methionyl-tRNA formyltransferase [Lacunisphaera limnophila]|uniref:Methionyl-tRNA formyltransferase n=1 Tax=Lacunisphaera limnophila TaxID=1838286 RepID=A0A1D8AYQ0_9BACT|nr:methionyl-tRNA formyltransferase [Lacunisphaera limnophila]AOS45995.1 Methionyl-tRNA formyltransferase [Lacunisphaera limnophila]